MSATATVIMVLICYFVGYKIGRMRGDTAGRDAQWCDDFFDAARKDRERRDKLGRFKAKRPTHSSSGNGAGNETPAGTQNHL